MDKGMIDLISRLFSPRGALVALIFIGFFTALYTAIIKFLFQRRLDSLDAKHTLELAKLQGEISARTQVLIQNLQAESNRGLKELEAELARKTQSALQESQAILTEEQSEKQSRLDYEYEARKRLYHDCEPLVFELLEFSEHAGDRIRGLARTARQGDLPRWLSGDEYYMASTLYYLLAPMAVYKLMRRHLTVVDMRLDRNIARHYQCAKRLAWSFADDFSFAWGLQVCAIEYDPNNPEWQTLRLTEPAKHWRQGLPYGHLDNAVESMILDDVKPNGNLRIMGFGQFESALHDSGSRVCKAFTIIQDIFTDFHPATRPVLWRILIAQAHIYASIVEFHKGVGADRQLEIMPISKGNRERFYWEKAPSDADRQKMEEPFTVAEAYLKKYISSLWVP
jgi:hypothetical protein